MNNDQHLIAELNLLNKRLSLLIEIAEAIREDTNRLTRNVPDTELALPVRTRNILRVAGLPEGPVFVNELVAKIAEPLVLLRYRNFGRKSLNELIKAVNEAGYPDWGH